MSQTLTLEEQAGNYATMQHMARVRDLLHIMIKELLDRARLHDQSKLAPPEVAAFALQAHKLNELAFGSPEYEESKKRLGDALVHHYARNRHHPEHWPNGVADMSLIDLLEMFCDWKAGSERQLNGNLRTSIEINGRKYKFPAMLLQIFENSIDLVEPN